MSVASDLLRGEENWGSDMVEVMNLSNHFRNQGKIKINRKGMNHDNKLLFKCSFIESFNIFYNMQHKIMEHRIPVS